jgi:membrane protease YdiL (CAAX protease family)
MLSGSLMNGKYVFDTSTIDPKHIYFSLVPGIFEEIIFRGFIMIVLIKQYKSIKKAALFQIVLFTVSHMKDFTFWGLIDTLTVAIIAIAFTYVAFKTGSLITGIIFHFIHDAFLFVVQLPEGRYEGIVDNLIFYFSVWIGMGVIILVIKILAEKVGKPLPSKIYQNALNDTSIEI